MHTNNSTQQHTPTPWTWARQNPGALTEGENELFFINSVAFELSKANAEFIVRACNAHDELVAALEGTIDCLTAHELDCARDGLKNASSAARDALSAVRAVLAKL